MLVPVTNYDGNLVITPLASSLCIPTGKMEMRLNV